MQSVTTSDDVKIAYLSLGEGPPIVFASNIFGDAHHYHREWPHVRGITDRLVGLGWRVVRYDHRGMGFSERHVADLSLEARVRDLTAVVAQLGLARFALVGLDLGAATAVAYAVQHEASVSHLVLLSPWASGAQMFALPDLRVAALAAPTGETAPATNDREWKVFAHVLGSVATAFEERDLGVQAAENILQSTSPSGLAAYYKASAAIDITTLLPRVAVPTLVIHEPAFRFGSFALCQEVAAGIRDAQFVIVADNSIAGRVHDGHVTAIDQFLRSGTVTARTPRAPTDPLPVPLVAPDRLTSREVQVLRQVAAGLTNKEIAAELAVAVSTVERHLVNLYTKIGARGRADAVAYALRHGLDTPPA
jgi:pimeloyl-ACP methyl ester carboxylesterase/DNA-binding CsgD family transcriptional regulator